MALNPVDLTKVLNCFVRAPLTPAEAHSQFRRVLARMPVDSVELSEIRRLSTGGMPRDLPLFDLLDEGFSGQPANPNKKATVDRQSATFEENAYVNSGKGGGYSSFGEIRADLLALARYHPRMAVVGPRGSGKTAIVNRFLNDATRALENLKIVWSRIDLTKIYQLLHQYESSPEGAFHCVPNLRHYYVAHTAFIFAQYSGLIRLYESELSPLFTESLARIRSRHSTSPVPHTIDEVAERISPYMRRIKREVDERFLSETIVRDLFKHKDEFKWFELLYCLIMEDFRDNQITCLAIVDGIDNVSWAVRNGMYRKVIDLSKQFVADLQQIHEGAAAKVLLVARPETVPELQISVVGYNHGRDSLPVDISSFYYIRVPPCRIEAILSTKIMATAAHETFEYDRKRVEERLDLLPPAEDDPGPSSARIQRFMQQVNAEVPGYQPSIVKVIGDVLNQVALREPAQALFVKGLSEGNLLTDIYQGDLRAVLDGFRIVMRARRVAHGADERGAAHPLRNVEYLLRGGRIVFSSVKPEQKGGGERYDSIPRGEVFPNIFWYPTHRARDRYQHKWHGLACLRFLQAVFARGENNTAADIMCFLHEYLEYSPHVLRELVSACVAYGLVNVRMPDDYPSAAHTAGYGHGDGAETFAEFGRFVDVTPKGRLVATLSLYFIEWIYWFALDTPMHEHFMGPAISTPDERFLRVRYDETNKMVHNLFEAMVPTVTTLLRHITHYNAIELAALARSCSEFPDDCLFHGVPDIKPFFDLPQNFIGHAMDRFRVMLEGYAAQDMAKFEQLSQHIEGVFRIAPP